MNKGILVIDYSETLYKVKINLNKRLEDIVEYLIKDKFKLEKKSVDIYWADIIELVNMKPLQLREDYQDAMESLKRNKILKLQIRENHSKGNDYITINKEQYDFIMKKLNDLEIVMKNQSEEMKKMKHGYSKYKEWIKDYNNDEMQLEYQIKSLNESNDILVSEMMNSKYSISVKVFRMDLNICFKIINESSSKSIRNDLKLKINYIKDSQSVNIDTMVIELQHGIGPGCNKIVSRFQHEFGYEFNIKNIKSIQLVNSADESMQYIGIVDKVQDAAECTIFNFIATRDNMGHQNTVTDRDIISTTIESCQSEYEDNSHTLSDIEDYNVISDIDLTEQ